MDFQQIMTAKTEEELQVYFDESERYTPEAIEAAFEELKKRGKVFSDEEVSAIQMKIAASREELSEEKPVFSDSIVGQPELKMKNKKLGFLNLFIPSEGYKVTPVLIGLNILVFILMLLAGANIISPDGEIVYKFGGNFGRATIDGQWWRLFTSTFIHHGIIHLLMNMYALLYIGLMLESRMGTARYLSAYVMAGIVASVTSIAIHPEVLSAGASGAIFGMYGVFLAMLTTNLIPKEVRRAVLPSIGVYVGYNLVYGMKAGIDNAAHIGGLVSGILVGYGYYYSLKHYEDESISTRSISIAALVVLVATVGTMKVLPNTAKNERDRYALMNKFGELESAALKLLELPENTSKEKKLYQIKEVGLAHWDKCEAILSEIDRLDLPKDLRERNAMIHQYIALRKQSYDLMYKQVQQDTDVYGPRITELNGQIENVLADLEANLE